MGQRFKRSAPGFRSKGTHFIMLSNYLSNGNSQHRANYTRRKFETRRNWQARSTQSHGPESFPRRPRKGSSHPGATVWNYGQVSFHRSISLHGYPVDSGFGDEPQGQLKRDHSGSPSGDWRGTGKFGRISWITNEERNDIKLTDFRTHNHETNSVRQRVDRVEMKEREKTIASR